MWGRVCVSHRPPCMSLPPPAMTAHHVNLTSYLPSRVQTETYSGDVVCGHVDLDAAPNELLPQSETLCMHVSKQTTREQALNGRSLEQNTKAHTHTVLAADYKVCG